MANVGAGRQRVYLRTRERARKVSHIKSKMHLRITVWLMLLTCGCLKVRDGPSRNAEAPPFTETKIFLG
jgi:hypothetical protein